MNSKLYENFQGATVGQLAPGWATMYTAPNVARVEESGGQKYLRVVRATNGKPNAVSWGVVPSTADVKLFALFSTEEAPSAFVWVANLLFRASGTADNETAYAAMFFGGSTGANRDWRINRFVNGTMDAPAGNNTSLAWQANTVYAARVHATGSTIQARIWQPADPFTAPTADEPAGWSFTITESTITSAGKVGFGTHTGSSASRLYAIGVSWGGDPAPHEPIDTEPAPTQLDTTFTGANGSPWPTPWQHAFPTGSSGGAVDIQSNRGRMQTHSQSYSTARAEAVGISVADSRIESGFHWPAVGEQYAYLNVRASGWNGAKPWEPWNGYGLCIWQSGVTLDRFTAGTKADPASGQAFSSRTWQANTDYKIVVEAEGQTLRAKVWPASSQEPAGWDLVATDGIHSAGGVSLSLLGGGSAGTRRIDWNYLSVAPLEDSPPVELGSMLYRWDQTAGTLTPCPLYLAQQL
jgi:uncharacterized protein YbdZ (MbtH family)